MMDDPESAPMGFDEPETVVCDVWWFSMTLRRLSAISVMCDD